MRAMKLGIMMLCLFLVAGFLYGCGSSHKEGSGATSPETVGRVGDTVCFQCHSATLDPLTGESIVVQYKRSTHSEIGCESCHGGGAEHNGIGPLAYTLNSGMTDAEKAARCAMCHNGIIAPLSSSPNFQNGNHANPFSEEEAHEAKCSRCHSHEGAVIQGTAGYTGERDIMQNAAYEPVLPRNPETFNTIKCATCHEHGGNLRQWTTRNAAGEIVAWDPNKNFINDQIDLCTGCHTMTTNEGVLIGSGNTLTLTTATGTVNVPTAAFYHYTAWYRILPSTHYDQPATIAVSGGVIEGYNIRTVGQVKGTDPDELIKNPCFDCHGHEFKTNTRALANRPERGSTIFTDWAQSGHAGNLLRQKAAAQTGLSGAAQVDAVMKAGVTEASGAAWIHYDWDNSTGTSSDRKSCQRCHTSTGVSNFLNSPSTYNPANNNFDHLSGWEDNKTSPQNELLYCWGCHSNAGTGVLRNPGAITETYSAGTAGDPPTTVSYPDAGSSNVCLACHLGREIGDVIKNDQDADGVRSFINSHYLTAGGTVFGKTGYTLFGRDYDSAPKGFIHDKLGISATGNPDADAYIAANGLSSDGPCVVCHLNSEKLGVKTSHLFSPFSEYAGGDISLNPVCVNCHGTRGAGSNAKAAWFEGQWKLRANAALAALGAQLAGKGIHFFEAHPYFYNGAGGTGGAFTNWAGVNGFGEWKNVMGTAFNYNVLAHDPGAVAHNRYYVRRLIYDSLDYLDDYTPNYSVFATLNALPAGTAYKADAITFLINRGTGDANVGTAAERF